MNVAEIDRDLLGSRVRTEGIISEISWFRHMVIFDIKEEGREDSLNVVCDREIIESDENRNAMVTGTKVTVEGKLEEYEGDMNLKIDSIGELSIEERAISSFTPLSEILENPEWFEGMKVKVQGEIIEIDNSSEGATVILTGLESEQYEVRTEIADDLYNGERNLVGYPAELVGYVTYESHSGTWKLRCTDSFQVNSVEV
ncbi:MAG: hypothetical protein V5A66_00190 [Candidatus Thermoplasmatota archaeon]